MTENTGMNWGVAILIGVVLLAIFVRGNLFGGANEVAHSHSNDFYGHVPCNPNWQSEKQEILDTAKNRETTLEQANLTRANSTSEAEKTRTKIDFYAYQDLRDKLADEQRKTTALESRLYSNDQFNTVNSELATIKCQMLKQPALYGTAVSCPATAVNNFNPYQGGCLV